MSARFMTHRTPNCANADRPGFIRAVVLALLLAITAALLGAAGETLGYRLVASPSLLSVLIPLLTAAYLVCLNRASGTVTGRLALAAAWVLVALALPLGGASLTVQLTVHSLALALLKTWLFALRPLAAMAELLIALAATSAAIAALLHTGSVAIAAWCFFLAHASGELLPPHTRQGLAYAPNDRFESAHRQAEAALRRLGRTG